MSSDIDVFEASQIRIWSAGDFGKVAERITPVGRYVAKRAGAGPGVELLDVASGTGNVSLPAAQAGATVTALDVTQKLLDEQREQAKAAGLEVELVRANAEEMRSVLDGRLFDRVTSTFGVMYLRYPQAAAEELLGVVRSDGEIVLAAWTPDGLVGRTFGIAARYMPSPSEVTQVSWGDEEFVRSLLEGLGASVSSERRTVTFEGDSVEAWIERDERILGPAVLGKAALEQQGSYGDYRREMVELYEHFNDASDGSFRAEVPYLVTVVRPPVAPSDG